MQNVNVQKLFEAHTKSRDSVTFLDFVASGQYVPSAGTLMDSNYK